MATALQLVNRVRRQLRWGDTASLARDDDKAILDAVNAAVAVIFETWDWECDLRHDGALLTVGDQSMTTLGRSGLLYTTGADVAFHTTDTNVTLNIAEAVDRGAVLKLVVTEDTTYGDTAFLMSGYGWDESSIVTSTISAFSVGDECNITGSNLTSKIVCNEYVLPSTVRKVTSVRHQETSVTLEEVGRSQYFERMIQRPHETISDQPELCLIGGMATSTPLYDYYYDGLAGQAITDSVLTAGATGTSLMIYPTPSTDILLNYSYLMKRPEMTATTDTLANADRALEDFVVQLAYARCINNFVGDADPGAGLALEQRVMNMARVYHANQGKDPSRRRVIGSNFCEGFGSPDFGRFPRNFGTGT